MMLSPSSMVLRRIIMGPGGRGCSQGGGPTMRFVQGMVSRGGTRGLRAGSCCRCDGCRGVGVSLGSIAPRDLRGKVCGGFSFLGSRIRISPRAGGLVLPVSMRRASSGAVCEGSPRDGGAVVRNVGSGNMRRFFSANSVLNAVLGSMFTSVGVCSSSVHLLRHHFMDPVKDKTVSFCGFCLVSAIVMSGGGYMRLAFIPRGPRSFKFAKRLCILSSSACTMGGYAVGLPGGAKMGFIRGLSIIRRCRRLPGNG